MHHTQDVAAHDLMNLGFGITAIEQRLRDQRISRYIFQLRRQRRDAIVVRPDADMVDSRNTYNVVDMIDDIMNRTGWNRMFGTPPLARLLIFGVVRKLLAQLATGVEHL